MNTEMTTTAPWVLYLLGALMALAVGLVVWSVFFRRKGDSPYDLYIRDTIFDVAWTWQYQKRVPTAITCRCPECGNPLFYDEHQSGTKAGVEVSLECETCDRTLATVEGNYAGLLKRVQGHIERKIASGRWREGQPPGDAPSSGPDTGQ